VEDFRALPPLVVIDRPRPVVEIVFRTPEQVRVRRRALALTLELGDNLFRRGRHREAFRHFELALSLSDGAPEVQARLDSCRPLLPPPRPPQPVFVPTPVVKPRLIVFSFLVNTRPGLVPPNLGDWATDAFAAYFGPRYEIVDRGEVCWYMGRLGITARDVM